MYELIAPVSYVIKCGRVSEDNWYLCTSVKYKAFAPWTALASIYKIP